MHAPPEKPVSWVSRYGSITFNQMGKEFPFGGMNEKGLVVQMMWLEDTHYPQPDERPAITPLQWIQYQLDNAGTVDEVIESNNDLRITAQTASRLHYLVCDRQGNAATVEFIEGKLAYHTGEALPVAALTNSTYDECLQFYMAFDSLDAGEQFARTSYDSKDRFVKIARRIRDFESENIRPAVQFAYDILASVGTGKHGRHCTAWSIVYDVGNLRLSFKTFENRNIRVIDLDDFNFACSAPAMALNMSTHLKGDVSAEFVKYKPEMNGELVTSVMAIYQEAGFMSDIPDVAIQLLINYPETVTCEQAEAIR